MDITRTTIDQILGIADINRRCAVYQNLQQHLSASKTKNLLLNNNIIKNLATIIRKDCELETGQISNSAWDLLGLIVNSHVLDGEGELLFLHMLMGGIPNENIKQLVVKILKQRISTVVKVAGDQISIILKYENLFKSSLSVVDGVCNELSKDICVKFLLSTIIPMMFHPETTESLRIRAIDLGLQFVEHVNLNDIIVEEQSNIITMIKDIYLKNISDSREQDHKYWHKLWIFIIKFTHIKLHTSLKLMNKLLRIVEIAFRNTTILDQRLKAYNCWRELINNLSLNMDHLCSAKQLKLIITPLRAKLSRSPDVILERFNTFLYLIEKLQEKSVICLREFLEFCVGPIQNTIDLNKDRKCKLVFDVPWRTTIVLITIIGHQHNDEICVESQDLILRKPIINTENFKEFDCLLINAAFECCLVINDCKQEQRDHAMKCLWKSLFNLIANSPIDIHDRCYSQINNILTTLHQKRDEDNHYYKVLNIISEVAVNVKIPDNYQLLQTLFGIILNLACYKTATITNDMIKFISGFDNLSNNSELQTCLLEYYLNDTILINFDLFCECWMNVINFTIDLSHEKRLKILYWCITNLDKFKDPEGVCLNWMQYCENFFKSNDEKYLVLQNIEKLFLINPLLNTNIIQILMRICSNGNFTQHKDSNLKFLTIIESILSFPTLPNHNLQTVVTIITTYFDKNHHVYQLEDYNSILATLSNCIKLVVTIHKEFSILSTFQKAILSFDKDLLLIFSNNLTSFIETLILNDDDEVATQATKLSQLLEVNTNITDSTMKISTMSDNNANNKQKITHTNGDNNKDTKALPVLKISTKDSPLTRSSRMLAKVFEKQQQQQQKDINDESSSDFVKIDSEVKVELNKLNEHQKEILRKRRDDIPALYQDLSQSQTQDFPSNDDTTNDNSNINLKENLHQNITVRNKNKQINLVENVEEFIDHNNDGGGGHDDGGGNNKKTDENNSNIDNDHSKNDNSDDESSEVALIMANNSMNQQVKKAKKTKTRRGVTLSIRDYLTKRKRPKTPIKSVSDKNDVKMNQSDQQQQNKNDDHKIIGRNNENGDLQLTNDSSLRLNDSAASDVYDEQQQQQDEKSIQRSNRKKYINFEKRELRKRRPSVLLNDSSWYLDGSPVRVNDNEQQEEANDEEDKQKILEKKRLKKLKSSSLLNDYTWCIEDTTASVRHYKPQQQQQTNTKKTINEHTNKDGNVENKSKPILDDSITHFKSSTTTTINRSDKIKLKNKEQIGRIRIYKKLLNKSIDSINDFNIKRKRGRPLKRRNVHSLDNVNNLESQDIIESSQKSITLLRSSPRFKQQNSSPATIDDDQNDDRKTKTVEDDNEKKTENEEDDNENKTEILMKETQLTDTETCTSDIKSLTPNLQLDLPNNDELTETDIEMALMSTATLTPTFDKNLPSSPITPDRTLELISDTSNISPIDLKTIDNNIDDDDNKKAIKYFAGDRSMKMLQMANSTPQPQPPPSTSSIRTPEQIVKNRFKIGRIMSPSINLKRLKTPKQNDENLEVLTFTRSVPNNSQVPGSSILKRKTQSDEFQPNPKRKRVNFSDPAITSKKIIIKDPHEFSSTSTNEVIPGDLQIFNEIHDYMAMVIGKATDQGLDRQQIGELIKNCLKTNEIELDESPTDLSLRNQLKQLPITDAANLLSDYFETLNPIAKEQMTAIIRDTNKSNERIIEKFLLELSANNDPLEISQKINEKIYKISNDNDCNIDEPIDENVCKWKTDKFIDLFETFNNQLNNEERNTFLIDLMKRCSNNLTNSEFINDHFEITKNFVIKFGRM